VLLPALEPHAHVAGALSGLDVDDARPAADCTVLGVRLLVAAAGIDVELVRLPAKRALYEGPGVTLHDGNLTAR
jgi:hypothetical protein